MVKEYNKVYFRVETGYVWSVGHSEKDSEILKDEIRKIFLPLGFEIVAPEFSGACEEAVKGNENLYLHPQDFSGVVTTENIELIKQAIENSNITLRAVDIYETVYDADENWLMEKLNEQRSEYKERYFEIFKTTRKNKFVTLNVWAAQSPIKLINKKSENKAHSQFIISVINELYSEGLLIKMNNDTECKYYRSLNATELKKWKAANKRKEKHLA